jgi:NADH dehydrogenase FAD-containing subunit
LNPDVPLSVVSPRNHFVFTPLLPSCSVGTLECRVIQEPIRSILGTNGQYFRGKARSLDYVNKKVICESIDNAFFELEYDKLVIAVGVKTNTFGIESIMEAARQHDSVFFLKHLEHARMIRTNIIDAFEKASIPNVSDMERHRLLTFLVVGGGPTSCEFTAELHDFVKQDVKRSYHDLLPFVKIVLVEAGPALLGPFDKALQEYAHGLFKKRDIEVRLGTAVIGVEDFVGDDYRFSPSKRALLSDGTTLEFGMMVWSAGLAPRTFTEALDPVVFPRHPRNKRLLVDEFLRVKGHEGSIWAMGDAAINETGVPIPQLAQVARQQGIYLAKVFNGKIKEDETPFSFFSLGSMAFMGEWKGIYDGSSAGPLRDPDEEFKRWVPPAIKGVLALLLWRFAYWGRQTSVVNKILIPMNWMKTFVFGRDTSRY